MEKPCRRISSFYLDYPLFQQISVSPLDIYTVKLTFFMSNNFFGPLRVQDRESPLQLSDKFHTTLTSRAFFQKHKIFRYYYALEQTPYLIQFFRYNAMASVQIVLMENGVFVIVMLTDKGKEKLEKKIYIPQTFIEYHEKSIKEYR